MDKCLFIYENNILYNINYYKKQTNKNIIAVIKSNAYGHGIKEIVSILEKADVKMYAVSNVDEALKTREYTNKDILILDKIDKYNCLDESMVITIISKKHLLNLIRTGNKYRVHLKINISMKRKGINVEEVEECISLIRESNLVLEGIYTHYSSCKIKQVKKEYKKFCSCIKNVNPEGLMIHASSSVSSLILKEDVTNSIRIGVGMYGLKKIVKEMEPLKISTELKCQIQNCYPIKRFDRFSYDNRYFGKKGYIMMANIGYGDGLFFKERLMGYVDDMYIKEIGIRNMNNMYFYSQGYIFNNSEVEIFGKNLKLDDFSIKNKIAVCRLLSLLNKDIKKEIIN